MMCCKCQNAPTVVWLTGSAVNVNIILNKYCRIKFQTGQTQIAIMSVMCVITLLLILWLNIKNKIFPFNTFIVLNKVILEILT